MDGETTLLTDPSKDELHIPVTPELNGKYTTQTPTQDGYYWCRTSTASGSNPDEIVQVISLFKGLNGQQSFQYVVQTQMGFFTGTENVKQIRMDEFIAEAQAGNGTIPIQWAGPIPLPK